MTLTLTFHSLSIRNVNFLKHGGVRPSYGANAIADSRILEIDEIPVRHLTETEKSRKVNLLDKAILQIFKLLKMVLCSSCDGVPFIIQKEKRAGLQFTSTDYMSLLLTHLRIRWTIPLNGRYCPRLKNTRDHRKKRSMSSFLS